MAWNDEELAKELSEELDRCCTPKARAMQLAEALQVPRFDGRPHLLSVDSFSGPDLDDFEEYNRLEGDDYKDEDSAF
jgi:hypothetical protein